MRVARRAALRLGPRRCRRSSGAAASFVASGAGLALGVHAWDAGEPERDDDARVRVVRRPGRASARCSRCARRRMQPIPVPDRAAVERRLDADGRGLARAGSTSGSTTARGPSTSRGARSRSSCSCTRRTAPSSPRRRRRCRSTSAETRTTTTATCGCATRRTPSMRSCGSACRNRCTSRSPACSARSGARRRS